MKEYEKITHVKTKLADVEENLRQRERGIICVSNVLEDKPAVPYNTYLTGELSA